MTPTQPSQNLSINHNKSITIKPTVNANELHPGQSVSHHILFAFDVADVQCVGLKTEAPAHQSLVLVLKRVQKSEGLRPVCTSTGTAEEQTCTSKCCEAQMKECLFPDNNSYNSGVWMDGLAEERPTLEIQKDFTFSKATCDSSEHTGGFCLEQNCWRGYNGGEVSTKTSVVAPPYQGNTSIPSWWRVEDID